jgi:hypothetical protein
MESTHFLEEIESPSNHCSEKQETSKNESYLGLFTLGYMNNIGRVSPMSLNKVCLGE